MYKFCLLMTLVLISLPSSAQFTGPDINHDTYRIVNICPNLNKYKTEYSFCKSKGFTYPTVAAFYKTRNNGDVVLKVKQAKMGSLLRDSHIERIEYACSDCTEISNSWSREIDEGLYDAIRNELFYTMPYAEYNENSFLETSALDTNEDNSIRGHSLLAKGKGTKKKTKTREFLDITAIEVYGISLASLAALVWDDKGGEVSSGRPYIIIVDKDGKPRGSGRYNEDGQIELDLELEEQSDGTLEGKTIVSGGDLADFTDTWSDYNFGTFGTTTCRMTFTGKNGEELTAHLVCY